MAAHGFRVLSVCIISAAFEQPITELKTKIDHFVNKKLRNFLRNFFSFTHREKSG